MRSRPDRLLRIVAFALGAVAGSAVALFIYSNPGSQNLDWLGLHFSGVPVWSVGVVPLLVGLALGYAYHFPARWYHLKEHRRYQARAAELEDENARLRGAAPPHGSLNAPAGPDVGEAAAAPAAPAAPAEPVPQPLAEGDPVPLTKA